MSPLKDKKILVTGGAGFLGSRIVEKLMTRGVPGANILIVRSREHDLRRQEVCEKIVQGVDVVIHSAALVGGIGYNREHPAKAFYDNAAMGINLLDAAYRGGVKKFVGVGSVCEYPKFTPVPFKESDLWNGYPEETNAPYGIGKKVMLVAGQAYNQEYGFNAIHLLAVNLYGPGDNFDLASSHVIPALIRKIAEAKRTDAPYIEVWGSGSPTREFLYITDAAEGVVLAVENYDKPQPVNLGSGTDISIKDLSALICQIMDYHGAVKWDGTKPDGQPRRALDISLAEREFGFRAKISFEEGLRQTIAWYRNNI